MDRVARMEVVEVEDYPSADGCKVTTEGRP